MASLGAPLKVTNLSIFLLPFIISFIITFFVSAPGLVFILSYFIILGMVVGAFVFVDFLILYRRASNKTVFHPTKQLPNLRIAVLVTTFNEDPKLVMDTALSAKVAVGKQGHVFILDDSTDEATRKRNDDLENYGCTVIHRTNRRGYKAGAVNDWLQGHGSHFDLMAIFDADQRPLPFLFSSVTPYFGDEKIAFVQIPQYYSEISTGVSLGAFYQQLPFLRLVMSGRDRGNSAFSLGSGTVYRVKYLREIGGLDDSTITEDISTALDLHAKGWKSAYIDKPLIWYGMPPKDIAGYWVQQGRWSLGGFQLLRKLLSVKLSASQFFDYFNGWLYWFTVGPITLFELIAPALFLLFGLYFFNWNPAVYLAAYIPYFIASVGLYLFMVRKQHYGIRGFFYHHTVQLLAFVSVTSSFVGWLMRKKRPFAVTPKGGDSKTPRKILLTFSAIAVILALSAVKGAIDIATGSAVSLAAYGINIFWAAYFAGFFTFGLYIIGRSKPYSDTLKVGLKPAYVLSSGRGKVISLACEAVEIEQKVSDVYGALAVQFDESDSAVLTQLSRDSAMHARMLRQILSWLNIKEQNFKISRQTPMAKYLETLEGAVPSKSARLDGAEIASVLQLMLDVENYFNEEIYLALLSQIFLETLTKNSKYAETKRMLERIRQDEERHAEMIRLMRNRFCQDNQVVYEQAAAKVSRKNQHI